MPTTAPSESDDIVTVKEIVKELFKENGGHKRVMLKLNVSQTRAYGFTDEQGDENISFARIVQLTSSQATAAARYLAQLAGGVFFPLATQAGSPMKLIGEAARSHGEALAESLKALADGVIDGTEQRSLVPKVDEAIRALASFRATLAAPATE